MAKKIRLIDEEKDLTPGESDDNIGNAAINADQVKTLMKLAEAIDWKLWEMLKLMRKFDEEK